MRATHLVLMSNKLSGLMRTIPAVVCEPAVCRDISIATDAHLVRTLAS